MKRPLPSLDSMNEDVIALGASPLEEQQAGRLRLLAELYEDRNERFGLLGRRELSRLWKRHFLESLAYELLISSDRVIDIGSGAGLPGLVLGIRGFHALLLEPRRKRALFLEAAVAALELSDVEVSRARVEKQTFSGENCFVARAVSPPDELLSMVRKATDGQHTIITRVPPQYMVPDGVASIEMRVPPLDRPGKLLQFRQAGGASGLSQ